ncbi:hypothetical protein [Fischerella major]|uniref:hypothetical protein n=1 Tax=Fischerella major TaxID=210993 RepID=UPI0015B9C346|nr:hypothetical protein [Fischerella major]
MTQLRSFNKPDRKESSLLCGKCYQTNPNFAKTSLIELVHEIFSRHGRFAHHSTFSLNILVDVKLRDLVLLIVDLASYLQKRHSHQALGPA